MRNSSINPVLDSLSMFREPLTNQRNFTNFAVNKKLFETGPYEKKCIVSAVVDYGVEMTDQQVNKINPLKKDSAEVRLLR